MFIAHVPRQEPWEILFRHLGEVAESFREQPALAMPIAARPTIFTARALGGACEIEWLAEGRSPLPGGARNATLVHGEVLDLPDGRRWIYAEPPGRRLGDDTEAPGVAQPHDLAPDDPALHLFVRLPYVSAALDEVFVERAKFVQYRDGRVPRVRQVALERDGHESALRVRIEVYDLFSGEWAAKPWLDARCALSPADVDLIGECAAWAPRLGWTPHVRAERP